MKNDNGKDGNDLIYVFMVGVFLTIVGLLVLGGLLVGDLRRDGTALLESDTSVRILMVSTFPGLALFATDAGYVLYDGDRLYMEMDRCEPVEAGQ